jgi:deoxyribodipyrimidine photo-lyase
VTCACRTTRPSSKRCGPPTTSSARSASIPSCSGRPAPLDERTCSPAWRRSTSRWATTWSSAAVIRRQVIPELAVEVGAASVHLAEDFGPYGRQRDDVVADRVVDAGMELVRTGSPYAVPPGSVMNRSGSPYKVFTPFSRAWREHGWPDPVRRPSEIPWRRAEGDPIPDAPELGDVVLPRAGEDAAGHRLDHFLRAKVQDYDEARDLPGADATSRLSPYLKWGCPPPPPDPRPPRRHEGRAGVRDGAVLARVLRRRPVPPPGERPLAIDPKLGGRWSTTPATRPTSGSRRGRGPHRLPDRRRRDAPAASRGLDAQPGPHDRRQLPRQGPAPRLAARARWFMEHLRRRRPGLEPARLAVDRRHGHRRRAVLPGLQPGHPGAALRPRRHYVRRYLPELAGVADRWIHEPHRDPAGPPAGYPPPIVDHKEEREEALRRYDGVR